MRERCSLSAASCLALAKPLWSSYIYFIDGGVTFAREQDNSFKNSWRDFFIEQRLRPHMNLIVRKFPEEAKELILLAPLIFDKTRQVRQPFVLALTRRSVSRRLFDCGWRSQDKATPFKCSCLILTADVSQVLEDHHVRPSILHGNLSPQRTGVVKMSINGVDLKHAYLTGPCSFYGDRLRVLRVSLFPFLHRSPLTCDGPGRQNCAERNWIVMLGVRD